jgi:hypothetical protein
MTAVKSIWILLGIAALSVAACSARADVPTDASGVQSAQAADAPEDPCNGASPTRARWLGDAARRQGEYQRAAECYLVAGEPVAADRAYAKAFVEANARTSQKAAATVDDAKLQARRIRQAFRSR